MVIDDLQRRTRQIHHHYLGLPGLYQTYYPERHYCLPPASHSVPTGKRKNPNPRYNFKHDLTKFITQQQHRGTDIMLLGDFNEFITSQKAATHHICSQCTLIDIWKRKHQEATKPNTCLHGRTRIDYAQPAVIAVGHELFHHTAITDHRGLFVDFNTEQLFDNTHNLLASATQRILKTQQYDVKATYIQQAGTHGHENNLFARLAALTDSPNRDDSLIERLHTILGQCCHVGKNRCKEVRLGDRSSKIEQLRIW
jgi:hypothetical protein